ncbi:hypothetical protein [Streptomyces sp. NPDC001930]
MLSGDPINVSVNRGVLRQARRLGGATGKVHSATHGAFGGRGERKI